MITLAITTYNRPEMTMKSFEKVIDNPFIDEIIIVDDYSKAANQILLAKMVKKMPKVHLLNCIENIGCYHNKRRAVSLSSLLNDWVILLDSDNVIDDSYIKALVNIHWEPDTIYAPEFARPFFDYRHFAGKVIDKDTVKHLATQKQFDCLINTCNYFVHRETYLKNWVDHPEPWTADTLFHNYNHLKAGGNIKVVEGMQYDHLVHDGSHYQEHVNKTGTMGKDYLTKITQL